MSLELKEIHTFSYSHESVQPFSIQISASGIFAIMTKRAVQIMRPEFTFHPDLNLFNLKPFVIRCPLAMPTHGLDTEEVAIYNSASHLQRQTLLLDQRFFPKLSNKTPAELIQSQSIAWNDIGVLGYVSNYGGFELFQQIPGENDWESVLDVGSVHYKYITKGITFPIKTITDMITIIDDLIITCICFISENQLLATTRSNKICTFKYDLGTKDVKVVSCTKLSQKTVSVMKRNPNDGTNDPLVVCGSMDGTICIYKVKQGIVEVKSCLWKETDEIPVTSIEVLVIDEGWLILATKGGHVIWFQLDPNLKCVKEARKMMSPIPITGIAKLDETSFLTTLLTGEVKKVEISYKNETTSVHDVKLDFSLAGCTFYGLVPSPNVAYFVLVSFVTQPNDHLIVRQPLNLTVCHLSDPFQQLLSTPRMTLSSVKDTLDVVRYVAAKDDKLLQSYESQVKLLQNIGFTQKFQFLLKQSLVLTGARYTYLRLRSQAEAGVCYKRIERLCQVLEVIRANDVLTCLLNKKSLTPFETRSGQCLRLFLLEYVAVKPVTEEFQTIYDVLTPDLISLTARFGSDGSEKCQVCDKDIKRDSLKCEEGHETPRCSITKLQLDTLNARVCPQCRRNAWNDQKELKQVVGDREELLLCPVCDISFENA